MAAEEPITQAKACKKCGETKPLDRFPKCLKARDGKAGTCIKCKSASRRGLEQADPHHRWKSTTRTLAWRGKNRDKYLALKVSESERRRRRQGVRPLADVAAEVEAARKEREAVASSSRLAREQAAEAKRRSQPWLIYPPGSAERFASRYRIDPEFNMRERLRAAERRRLRGGKANKIADLFRDAVKSGGKSPALARVLGYTVADLKLHLQRQFTRGMTWQAFNSGEIHIDHILPLSGFDLLNPVEHRAAWALSNLRPLWKGDNLAKGDKRILLL